MTGFAAILFSGSAWLIPAIVAVVLLGAALVRAGQGSAAERRVRLACGSLKLAGILALALCLLEPMLVRQRARPGANLFALVADNSQSLEVRDAGESQSRGDRLRAELTAPAWQSALEHNFQVRRYVFDSRLRSAGDFGELTFAGRASALGQALQTARDHWRGQPVAGVLLFTDGNATDLEAGWPELEGLPPIYPVVLGADSGLRDISLDKATASQTAFEDAPVTVQAQVASRGFAGSPITVRLKEIAVGAAPPDFRVANVSNVLATQTQRATGAGAALNFRFQIQPDKPGIHFYELEAGAAGEAAGAGEATLANNRRVIAVDRGQELLRVLYVCGRPNWDYKFLNRAIQQDPQVQLVALVRVARREPKFEFLGRAGESSNPLFRGFGREDEATARYDQPVLIRLNTRDEFELRGGFPKTAEELFGYQAVILDDVEAGFFTHDQQALLQRFVSERGGGFLMLGGADSFREGNYAGTPIAALLPVYLDRPAETNFPGELKLTLTRDGWFQPWTRLRATEAEEKARLEALPPFEVLNPAREIKPGASVLATAADALGRERPALAVQRFGHGHAAALMIGDLWRWGLRDETMQDDLGRFWRQLVRWLVSDVPPRISVAAGPAPDGDPAHVRLVVKARDEESKPADGAAVKLTVRRLRGLPSPGEAAPGPATEAGEEQLTADASTAEPGLYESIYVAREAGAYSVEAQVTTAEGKLAGRAAAGWASDPAAEEFRSLTPNRALLETLARRTGGELVTLEGLGRFVRSLPDRRAPITETFTDPLWHKPAVLLFALCCFVAEWGVRRWKGMP